MSRRCGYKLIIFLLNNWFHIFHNEVLKMYEICNENNYFFINNDDMKSLQLHYILKVLT